MTLSGCPVPAFMLALKNPTQDQKQKLKLRPLPRKDVSRSNGAGTKEESDRKLGRKKGMERVLGGTLSEKERARREKGEKEWREKKKSGKMGEGEKQKQKGKVGKGKEVTLDE